MSITKSVVNKLFKNKAGEYSVGTTMGTLFTGYMGISTYNDSRAEGDGVLSAAASAAGDTALSAMLNPAVYMGLSLAPELAKGAVDAYDSINTYGRRLQAQSRNRPFQNATFVDSQQTYTMRQAGMNLARQGQFAASQTTMGNEASSVAVGW